MFIPLKEVKTGIEISEATISRWNCTTIKSAYSTQSGETPPGVKAHEVRAVSTSPRLFSNTHFNQVIEAGSWHSGGTFSKFYLRDLVSQEASIRSPGSIVTAVLLVTLPS
jgi:hypothetical protein